jgi:UDP-glucose 4-epimerase
MSQTVKRNKKSFLITGSSGFIGRHLCSELLQEGHDLTGFDLDPGQSEKWETSVGDIRAHEKIKQCMVGVDSVIHLAGVLGTLELYDQPENAISNNLNGLCVALESAVANQIKEFVYISTPDYWNNIYSFTKTAGENLCFAYQKAYGIKIKVIRLWNVFGPFQSHYPIKKLFPEWILRGLHNLPLEIYEDIATNIAVIYVKDVARLLMKFACVPTVDYVIYDTKNVCQEISLIDLADIINNKTGNKSGYVITDKRIGEFLNEFTKTTSCIGDVVKLPFCITDFDTALNETISYYSQFISAPPCDVYTDLSNQISVKNTKACLRH